MKRGILSISLLIFLGSCSKPSEVSELEDELSQLRQSIADLSAPNTDRNSDGEQDLFVETEDGSTFELLDRDFDGRVDESWRYDENDNLISGKVDEDFNGILETQYIYEDFSVSKVLSDSDGNLVFDIFTKLHLGVMEYSEKYYAQTAEQASPRIGRVEYRYGYPVGSEVVVETSLSETEFADSRL